MKTDGLILLAVDFALLLAVFVILARIHSRIERIEKRLYSKRQKKAAAKKD